MTYFFIMLITLYTLFSHNINAHSFQEKDIAFNSQDHLIVTIQNELRTNHYRKEVLPNDFSYFSVLLDVGVSAQQPSSYVRSIVKLFSNMLKSSHYVNASAFSRLLETLPSQLARYFSLPSTRQYIVDASLYEATFLDRFKSTVQTVLYSKFSTEYEAFRQDPDLFLRNITSNIVIIAQEEIIQEQLRQGIIRFCEAALSKLIWNPTVQEETWFITKKIAEQLATLLEYNILDDANDVDDLHWTLLNRYCYFVELTATDMPESFYKAIKDDIHSDNSIVIFALNEQDHVFESKLSCMQRTLIEAETTSYRHRLGLL